MLLYRSIHLLTAWGTSNFPISFIGQIALNVSKKTIWWCYYFKPQKGGEVQVRPLMNKSSFQVYVCLRVNVVSKSCNVFQVNAHIYLRIYGCLNNKVIISINSYYSIMLKLQLHSELKRSANKIQTTKPKKKITTKDKFSSTLVWCSTCNALADVEAPSLVVCFIWAICISCLGWLHISDRKTLHMKI